MSSDDSARAVTISLADRSMVEELAALRSNLTGLTPDVNAQTMEHRFFDGFSRDRSWVIVARHNNRIVGMQTYTYWPYVCETKSFYSVQSGMTLVHPEYRGQGVFSRMLELGDEILRDARVEFAMGFPGVMSFGGFIKDHWHHVMTQVAMVRVIRPFAMIGSRLGRTTSSVKSANARPGLLRLADISPALKESRRAFSEGQLHLKPDTGFFDFRYPHSNTDYILYQFAHGGRETAFICSVIEWAGPRVLCLGDILTTETSDRQLRRTLRRFVQQVKAQGDVDAVIVWANTGDLRLFSTLLRSGFLPRGSSGKFVVKPLTINPAGDSLILNARKWNTMWGDVDGWHTGIAHR